MISLSGHDQVAENDFPAAESIVAEHLNYIVRHGLSNIDNGNTYANDIREEIEQRLQSMGFLQHEDLESTIQTNLVARGGRFTPSEPRVEKPLEDMARERAVGLIEEVIAS